MRREGVRKQTTVTGVSTALSNGHRFFYCSIRAGEWGVKYTWYLVVFLGGNAGGTASSACIISGFDLHNILRVLAVIPAVRTALLAVYSQYEILWILTGILEFMDGICALWQDQGNLCWAW